MGLDREQVWEVTVEIREGTLGGKVRDRNDKQSKKQSTVGTET